MGRGHSPVLINEQNLWPKNTEHWFVFTADSGRIYSNTKKPQDGAGLQVADVICGLCLILLTYWPLHKHFPQSALTNPQILIFYNVWCLSVRLQWDQILRILLTIPLYSVNVSELELEKVRKRVQLQLLYSFFLSSLLMQLPQLLFFSHLCSFIWLLRSFWSGVKTARSYSINHSLFSYY